jgi:hypothetical protein
LEIDAPQGYPPGTTFHPTFLYEGLWNLSLAGLIVLAGRKIVLRPGRWMAVYVTGYGLGRLWVEALRIDQATQIAGFRVNTWISVLAIVGGLLWLFWGGNPIDREATARLRAGGDPLAHVGARTDAQPWSATHADAAPTKADPADVDPAVTDPSAQPDTDAGQVGAETEPGRSAQE